MKSICCLCGMILSVSSLKKGTSTWRKSCSDIGWNLSYDMSGGMRKPVVTSLRNRITDRRIAASEQAGNTECSSFDISAISLRVRVVKSANMNIVS